MDSPSLVTKVLRFQLRCRATGTFNRILDPSHQSFTFGNEIPLNSLIPRSRLLSLMGYSLFVEDDIELFRVLGRTTAL